MKKILKSLLAITLAASLLVPSTALAAPNYEINITKTLSEVTGNNAYFNGNTYTYTLTGGDDELLEFDGSNEITIAEGSAAGTVGTAKLKIDEEYLQNLQPGTHTYTLRETATAVDGETNTSLGEKTIVVTVYRNEETGKMEAVALVEGNDADAKFDLSSETKFATYTLTIEKIVKGNNADLSKEFEFTTEITKSQENDVHTISENTTLKNNETFTIDGLTPSDVAKVVEKEYEGYKVEYSEAVNEGLFLRADKVVTVTNTNETDIPTGVIETVAPFVAMIIVAGAFAVVYFKRNRIEA